jgi:hypothetical protein
MHNLIPNPGTLPIPAPEWFFVALLHLTFLVHLLFMNALLGGVIIALFARLFPGRDPDLSRQLVDRIAKLLPVLTAGAVTFGVAPLLFMQVLFGNFFYTSSILMGWPWFMVFVVLILGYYGFYLNSFRGEKLGRARTPIMTFSTLVLLYIALAFVSNNTLALRPDHWGDLYFSRPDGMNFYFGDRSILSRYLHMVVGALAVGGLLLSLLARRQQPGAARDFTARRGLGVFLFATLLNLGIGLWFMFMLPSDIVKLMMGGSLYMTVLFGLGFGLTLLLLVIGWWAMKNPAGRALPLFWATLSVMVVMILQRHAVRLAYLGPNYRPQDFIVGTQTLNIVIFLLLLIGGIVSLIWMLKVFFRTDAD